MRLSLSLDHSYAANPEVVFDFTNAAENFTTFVGFGIVPGIREARYEEKGQPRLGSRRRMITTDATEHLEEIVAFDRPRLHASRITQLSPPLRWLVREADDRWRFEGEHGGTRVARTFSVELTSPIWLPLAVPLMHVFLREALRRDLRNVGARLPRPAVEAR